MRRAHLPSVSAGFYECLSIISRHEKVKRVDLMIYWNSWARMVYLQVWTGDHAYGLNEGNVDASAAINE